MMLTMLTISSNQKSPDGSTLIVAAGGTFAKRVTLLTWLTYLSIQHRKLNYSVSVRRPPSVAVEEFCAGVDSPG